MVFYCLRTDLTPVSMLNVPSSHHIQVITNEVESSMDRAEDIIEENGQPSLVETFSGSHDQGETGMSLFVTTPIVDFGPFLL